MNLPIIRCDVCPAESTATVEGWRRFQYRFSQDVDAPPIDVCPACAHKLRQAIALVMAGKDLAVDEPQAKKLDTLIELVSRISPKLVEIDAAPPEPLELIERRQIESAMQWSKGNVSLAAKQLGIERSTLNRKLKAYGVGRPNARRELAVAQ